MSDSLFDGPGAAETDTKVLLAGYLDWYRETLERKLEGLDDRQLRTPLDGVEWAPLGLVQHLTGVERRWLQWGFRAEDMVGFPAGEWLATASTDEVFVAWREQAALSRQIVAAADLDEQARAGGRFPDPAAAPALIRILFHLLQEYARHVGQLDIVRELIDGTTGE
jgi:uncharacterized damage-inducible protein DinB